MAYAPLNGVQLYYETHGSGRPLVLLHGGLVTIDLNWSPLLEPLAARRPSPDVVELLGLLPDAQLAVLPGTTHIGVARRSDELLALVTPFLDAR
jgi:pimeloyl-ACP methyl ester carboxylesterase